MRWKRTPTHLEMFVFICFVCAFQVKLLSMYMPKDLVELVKGTIVLLVFIMILGVGICTICLRNFFFIDSSNVTCFVFSIVY